MSSVDGLVTWISATTLVIPVLIRSITLVTFLTSDTAMYARLPVNPAFTERASIVSDSSDVNNIIRIDAVRFKVGQRLE